MYDTYRTTYTARPLPRHIAPEAPKPSAPGMSMAQAVRIERFFRDSPERAELRRAVLKLMLDGRWRTVEDVRRALGRPRESVRSCMFDLTQEDLLMTERIDVGRKDRMTIYKVASA